MAPDLEADGSKASPLSVLVVGAGQRGYAYSTAIESDTLKQRCRVAAIAELDEKKRKHFANTYMLKPGNVFEHWKEIIRLADGGKRLDVDGVLICTLDWQHSEPAVAFAQLGYHVMLEKPLSTSWRSTMEIINTFRTSSKLFAVGHVLRYSPFYILLKRLVSEKNVAGQILHVQHTERVGWWHFAHSYVRGNWRNSGETKSSEDDSEGQPSLLAKCCHDTDLLFWLLDERPPTEIQDNVENVDIEPTETIPCNPSLHIENIGPYPESGRRLKPSGAPISAFSLAGRPLFQHHNKPPNSGTYCLECPIEASCLYSAKRIYITHALRNPRRGVAWPTSVIVPDIEDYPENKREEVVLSALAPDAKTNNYGRCVWDIPDNDVCENQTVTFAFDNELVATLNMVATAGPASKRLITIYGTLGEVHADGETKEIVVHTYADDTKRKYQLRSRGPGGASDAHGGGDFGLTKAFIDAMWQTERGHQEVHEVQVKTLGIDCQELERAYKAVWIAEKSRKTGQPVLWDSDI